MEKFSLAEYLKNPAIPIVTRDGNLVRIICTNRDDENYPIVALVRFEFGEAVMKYNENGEMDKGPCPYDLFFASEPKTKKVGWMNVCKYGDSKHFTRMGGVVFPTREEALNCKSEYSVDTIQIRWEEE